MKTQKVRSARPTDAVTKPSEAKAVAEQTIMIAFHIGMQKYDG
jgi:hypothetical protein